MAHQSEAWGHSDRGHRHIESESQHDAAHRVKECANEGGSRSDRWRRDDTRIVFRANCQGRGHVIFSLSTRTCGIRLKHIQMGKVTPRSVSATTTKKLHLKPFSNSSAAVTSSSVGRGFFSFFFSNAEVVPTPSYLKINHHLFFFLI